MSLILHESLDFRTAVRCSGARMAPGEKHRPACGLGSARRGGADPMAEPFCAKGPFETEWMQTASV
jgi:hypothetical protein